MSIERLSWVIIEPRQIVPATGRWPTVARDHGDPQPSGSELADVNSSRRG
jgi:hypothetical protein